MEFWSVTMKMESASENAGFSFHHSPAYGEPAGGWN